MRPALEFMTGLLCLLRTATVCPAKIAGSYDNSDGTELQEVLSHYEIINSGDIESTPTISSTAKVRRHVSDAHETGGVLRVQFTMLGRNFKLYLTPDTSIYADGFEAWSVDSSGSQQPILMSDRSLYRGHVHGEIDSHAFLYWNNQTMVAKIETAEETYYVEPARARLPGASSRSMLAYRLSDIRTNKNVSHPSTSFCGSEKTKLTDRAPVKTDVRQGQRSKRQTATSNSCSLFLIADYRFFRDVANESETAAILIMVNRAHKVDKIFRRTTWSNGWTNFGFSVRKVLIHTSWTSSENHYNAQRQWTAGDLLLALNNPSAHSEAFNSFCLVHLFTGNQLNGLLGYAYVGSPYAEIGICAYYITYGSDTKYENVGFSTQFGRNGRRLIESEAETLLAHELGHGWGSLHDPNTTECSPDPNDLYIMTTIADPHPKKNSKFFSPCSVKQITDVIDSDFRTKCFQVDRNPTRGNYRIDDGEQCDAGVTGDHCCGTDFELKTVDTCSDANHICCQNCSAKEAQGRTCQFESSMHCRAEAACDGVNFDCPITFRENGSVCFPDGSGRCLPQTDGSQEAVYCAAVCETLGFRSCRCGDASSMCKLCCQQPGSPCAVLRRSDYEKAVHPCADNTTRHCRRGDQFAFEPYDWKSDVLALPSDSPCLLGYCDSGGVCKKLPQDVLTIGKLLESLTTPKAVQFIKDNIVGTIVVFSLLLWIPASLCIHRTDQRMEREEKRRRIDSVSLSDMVSPHIARRHIPNATHRPHHVAIR